MDHYEARSAISQNIADFVFRERGAAALRDLFHPEATIALTWYSGGIDGFIEASRTLVLAKPSFGLPSIQVHGGRALSEVDVTSYARFFDRFVRCDDGRWRVLERTAIHEKDRMDPVRPSLLFGLTYARIGFDEYPAECRHLALALERQGFRLAHVVSAHSHEETALRSAAARWLDASESAPARVAAQL